MRKINDDVEIAGKLTVDNVGGFFMDKISCKFEELQTCVTELYSRLDAQKTEYSDLYARFNNLADKYNKAIKVINDLSERVDALENNYDPTVIK